MSTDQNIKVSIGGRPYTLTVNREEEEIVRKAAQFVDKTILEYSKSFEYKDLQDLYAMVALQMSANAIRLEELQRFRDEELENKLTEMDELLSDHLGK